MRLKKNEIFGQIASTSSAANLSIYFSAALPSLNLVATCFPAQKKLQRKLRFYWTCRNIVNESSFTDSIGSGLFNVEVILVIGRLLKGFIMQVKEKMSAVSILRYMA